MTIVYIPFEAAWDHIDAGNKSSNRIKPEFQEWLDDNIEASGYAIFRGHTHRRPSRGSEWKPYSAFYVRNDAEAVLMKLRWS